MTAAAGVLGCVICAAAGGAARYLLDSAVTKRMRGDLPTGILLVNLLGSVLLGLAAGALTARGEAVHAVFAAAAVFCGAFTTYSTAAVETAYLLRARRFTVAAAYWLGMAAVCIAGAWLAFVAARALAG